MTGAGNSGGTNSSDDEQLAFDAARAATLKAEPSLDIDPALDDADPDLFAQYLTEADIEALDSLGPSREFIREITQSPSSTPVQRQLDFATSCEADETISETIAYRTDALDRNMSAFEQQTTVSFHSNYRKSTQLGSGGQGTVYLVEGMDGFSTRRALKVFSPCAYDSPDRFVDDMCRMRDVASLIHQNPHDDLVDIEWFGEHEGVYAMLMQYIDGFDLRHLLKPDLLKQLKSRVSENRWKVLTDVVYSVNGRQEQLVVQPAMAVYLAERVLRGLEAMHIKGVVHGDIKPSNIMLNASGSVKIIDVGSAFDVAQPPAQHHITYAYTAPEFFESRKLVTQSDVASVGYMLIEMLSGKSIAKMIKAPDTSTRTVGSDLGKRLLEEKRALPDRLMDILPANVRGSDNLVELCRRLIAPDLNQRFPSASQSIVDPKGTFEFAKEITRVNLSVSGFQEIRQWLADAKQVTVD